MRYKKITISKFQDWEIAMKEMMNRFFSLELPIQKQLLNLVTVMGGVSSIILGSLSLWLNQDWKTTVLAYTCVLVSISCFFAGDIFKNTTVIAIIHIVLQNIIIFPVLHICSENYTSEFIAYYLIGFAYTAILLDGWLCFAFIISEFVIYISVTYFVMSIQWVQKGTPLPADGTSSVRMLLAIVVASLICGGIIAYRKRILKYETLKREEAANKALQSGYAKDMFLVNVSHEIRTPLNAIVGTAELLLEEAKDERIKENAYHALNSGKALLAITNDLLDFSRIEEQHINIEEHRYDLGEVLNEIINITAIRQLDKNTKLHIDINPYMPKILIGDEKKLRQVFHSLINNTNKNTNGGVTGIKVDFIKRDNLSGSLKVEITNLKFVEQDGLDEMEDLSREISLCEKIVQMLGGSMWVEDAETELKIVFEVQQEIVEDIPVAIYKDKFYGLMLDTQCMEDSNRYREVFRRMNLKLEIISEPADFFAKCKQDKYTHIFMASEYYEKWKNRVNEEITYHKFCIISDNSQVYNGEFYGGIINKPLTCLNLSAYLHNGKNYAVRRITYRGKFTCPNATIMVVDDNEINLEVAEEMLLRYNAKVIRAASGLECLKLLGKKAVDLIFMDYMMPELDGIDTLKRIRQLEDIRIRSTPVVALTANAVSGARDMFLQAGFQEYISKPIEREKLEYVILEYLSKDMIIRAQ